MAMLCCFWTSPADVAAEQVPQAYFTYVAMQYLRPWRPTFLLVEPSVGCGQRIEEEVNERAVLESLLTMSEVVTGYLTLTVQRVNERDWHDLPALCTAADFSAKVDLNRPWWVRPLLCSKRKTPCSQPPGTFRVHVQAGEVLQVWGGTVDMRRRPRAQDIYEAILRQEEGVGGDHSNVDEGEGGARNDNGVAAVDVGGDVDETDQMPDEEKHKSSLST